MASVFNTYLQADADALSYLFTGRNGHAGEVSVLLSHGLVSLLRDFLMGHHPMSFLISIRQDVVLNALEEGLIATDSNGVIALQTRRQDNSFSCRRRRRPLKAAIFKDLFS